jgi:hypothetical protein
MAPNWKLRHGAEACLEIGKRKFRWAARGQRWRRATKDEDEPEPSTIAASPENVPATGDAKLDMDGGVRSKGFLFTLLPFGLGVK